MKFFQSIGVLSLIMLVGISCKSSNNMWRSVDNIHRKWMLVEYKNFTKQELVSLEAYMDLTKNVESINQYSAKMGCNNLFFIAKFKANKIEFSKIGSTMMFCEGKMKLEELFSKDLPKINQYKIEGHFLTLTNEKGDRMKFVAADWD